MKWKRKGGRDRARAAGCQFVIAHVENIWIARYCDRGGHWSEPVWRKSKALAMQWCDDMADLETQLAEVDASELASRRALAAIVERRTPEEQGVIRIYRGWRTSSRAVRAALSKQHEGLAESMAIFEKLEKDQGITL